MLLHNLDPDGTQYSFTTFGGSWAPGSTDYYKFIKTIDQSTNCKEISQMRS